MSSSAASVSSQELQVRAKKQFPGKDDSFSLDIAFTAQVGFTILFGASGSGKTTLLDCIAGLTSPDSGRITLGEDVVFDSGAGVNISPNHRSVGYLLQSLALFPHMTVEQNVHYGLLDLTQVERNRRSTAILQSFRIAGLAQRHPRELSGGERQRAALARTLVRRPRVLLLDEPLTALDVATKSQIVADLRAWNRERQIPILYVTHQREEVFALGEHVLAIESGKIAAQGSPNKVLHRPELESIAQLAGFENILDARFVAAHPEQGTMTCGAGVLNLEVPLTKVDRSQPLRIGIRAGDILVASQPLEGLSARNMFPGKILSIEQRNVMRVIRVNCGPELEVHLTPGACEDLKLEVDRTVWLVVKTYSCQVLQSGK